jgi:hypothetical protein
MTKRRGRHNAFPWQLKQRVPCAHLYGTLRTPLGRELAGFLIKSGRDRLDLGLSAGGPTADTCFVWRIIGRS